MAKKGPKAPSPEVIDAINRAFADSPDFVLYRRMNGFAYRLLDRNYFWTEGLGEFEFSKSNPEAVVNEAVKKFSTGERVWNLDQSPEHNLMGAIRSELYNRANLLSVQSRFKQRKKDQKDDEIPVKPTIPDFWNGESQTEVPDQSPNPRETAQRKEHSESVRILLENLANYLSAADPDANAVFEARKRGIRKREELAVACGIDKKVYDNVDKRLKRLLRDYFRQNMKLIEKVIYGY